MVGSASTAGSAFAAGTAFFAGGTPFAAGVDFAGGADFAGGSAVAADVVSSVPGAASFVAVAPSEAGATCAEGAASAVADLRLFCRVAVDPDGAVALVGSAVLSRAMASSGRSSGQIRVSRMVCMYTGTV